MPTTYLSDLRNQVRTDLHDEDAAAYRWTDATLNRHIARALQEYSTASPLAATTTITAAAGVRAYSLAAIGTLTGRPNAVVAVEFPYDAAAPAYPLNLVKWKIWADTLYLHITAPPAAGQVIRVFYTTEHTLSETVRTFPADDCAIIALGAGAYAALERESYATERITIDDLTAQEYQRWGQRTMQKWQAEINFRRRSSGHATNPTHTWDTTDV